MEQLHCTLPCTSLASCLGMIAIYGANANAMRMLLTYLDVQKVHST